MNGYFLVFIGGGLGSLARFLMIKLIDPQKFNFPYATLIANVFSCFILGIVVGYFMDKTSDSPIKLLLLTGFCGGFSTFSTFAYESNLLFTSQHFTSAIANIVLNFALSILAIYAGTFITKIF
ncbi:fluoride efflux transporter CrcB [Pedobacter flavus]|uniref:Fluoride-specific ion channel FluC n=1 Tax=Pedobacter flavus TaxID=3113906 RepID=A0ABU7GYY5_9SPHI|nr:fluoride efflux transporter CrcB [Pedobacter sp. VNH31]MEE1884196.1 fluoride efflux transporter CrcB [Pedobacter sp. VNH31]